MRAEAEAFLHGFSLAMQVFDRSGLPLPPDVWEDAFQVAFLLYPPFDPDAPPVKVRPQ